VYHLGKQALLQQGDRNPLDTMKSAIYNGRAFEKFREIVIAHDGDLTSLKTKSLHTPTCQFSVKSPETGVIQSIDTLALGKAIVQLGGGRIQKTDVIDPTAGFTIYKKIGESVEEGEVVIEFYCSTNSKLEKVIKDSNDLFRVNNETPPEHPLIIS
jgi:thymidine phosphorylase